MERTESMLYVRNMSDAEKAATQPWKCCIAKKKAAAEFGSAFLMPVRPCAISGPAAACRAAYLRFLVSVPDTVGFKAQIGCRVSPQLRRNGYLHRALLHALNVGARSVVRTHPFHTRLRF